MCLVHDPMFALPFLHSLHSLLAAPPSSIADLGPLSLGKLTSLAEIEWVRREQADRCSSLRYYYLGFYIHNCHRMRYKVSFLWWLPAHLPCCAVQIAAACAKRSPSLCSEPPYLRPPGCAPKSNLSTLVSPFCRATLPSGKDQSQRIFHVSLGSFPSYPFCRATLRPPTCCAPKTSAGCRWRACRAR